MSTKGDMWHFDAFDKRERKHAQTSHHAQPLQSIGTSERAGSDDTARHGTRSDPGDTDFAGERPDSSEVQLGRFFVD